MTSSTPVESNAVPERRRTGMKRRSLIVSTFIVGLVLPRLAVGDDRAAEQPTGPPECQLLFEATARMRGPSDIPVDVTPELREAIAKGRTDRKTVLCEFYGVPSSASDPLEYDVLIMASTWEPDLRGDSAMLSRWQQYQRIISQKEAHAYLKVDRRGRIRIVPPKSAGEDHAGDELRAFSDALFPPLPEEGEPFKEGTEWSVSANGYWIPAGGLVRCESVKVWTTGETEIVVTSHREATGGAVAGGWVLSATADKRWVLRGNPPHVVEYRSEETRVIGGQATQIERHARVLSGGIPVRPVEHTPEKDEPSAPE
jgi:hypothetical protein